MPKHAVDDVPHSSFTDHWIRVVRDASEFERTRSEEGEVELTPYFARDEKSHEGQIYRGVAYFILGKTRGDTSLVAKGVEMLGNTLTESDTLGDAWYQLGYGLVNLRRFEEAVSPLERSVRLGPDVPERLNTLALLYERLRRPSRKIDGLFRHALDVQPEEAAIRVNYGRFLETLGKETEAAEQYRRALADQPSLATAHYNLGTLVARQGEVEEGQKELAEAIHLDPDYVDAYGNLAVVLATQGRDSEALVYFRRAVEAAPDDPVALNNLASYYLNHDEEIKSVGLLRKAVRRDPRYVDALVNLALALVRTGSDHEALEYANKALAIDPNNQRAAQIRTAVR